MRIEASALLAAAALAAGCDGGPDAPGALEIVQAPAGGDGQTGTVGQPLPAPLRVLVRRDGGRAEGVTVTWTATGNGAIASGTTDEDGIAEAEWRLGTRAGDQVAEASVTDAVGSPLAFHATAMAGPAAKLIHGMGNAQSAPLGQALSMPLEAIVRDEYDNPIPGATVRWSVTGGGGSVEPATGLTNQDGVAEASVTVDTSTGPSVITATADGLEQSPVQFTAYARLYVFVEDSYFGPADLTITAGTTVTWYWANAFGTHNVVPDLEEPARSGDPVSSTGGHDSYSYTFETPGEYRYYCQVHGLPGGHGMAGIIRVTP